MISKNKGFIESQGINIHYVANNLKKGKPLSLLFVPGIMMPGWIWEHQFNYFSTDYTVVAIDPRSQGTSTLSSEGHNAYSLAQDIKAVVDTLNLNDLVLIGWSISAPVALNYAAHFASNALKGLVLVDGIVGIDSNESFYSTIVNYWNSFQTDRPNKTRKFINDLFKQPHSKEYDEKLFNVAMKTPTNTVMTLISNYILHDYRSLLPKVEVPTLIATIEGPRLEYMQNMQKIIPHSYLEIFPSAGHALFVDQPEKFNRCLEDFLHSRLNPS